MAQIQIPASINKVLSAHSHTRWFSAPLELLRAPQAQAQVAVTGPYGCSCSFSSSCALRITALQL